MRCAGLALALAGLCLAGPAAAPPLEDAVPSGPSLDERLAEIARRVQAVVEYPALARSRGLAGDTLVAFRIRADGEPEQVRTRRSSGSSLLDRAAERAVRDAAPLPRVHGTVAVPVRFELSSAD